MACSFPWLPSQHNELHYSAPLSTTIAGLFWRDTPLVVRLKLGKGKNTTWNKICWNPTWTPSGCELDSHQEHTCLTYACTHDTVDQDACRPRVTPELKALKSFKETEFYCFFFVSFFFVGSISPSEIAHVWINPPTPLPPPLERVELIATASAKPLLMSYSHYVRHTHTYTDILSRVSCTQVYTKHTWNAQLKARNCLFHQLPLLRDQLGDNLITSSGKMQIGYTKGYSTSSLI